MIRYFEELIYGLLTCQLSDLNQTTFFDGKEHNNDLLPVVTKIIDWGLNPFLVYNQITYDIQGRNDRGADILVRLSECFRDGSSVPLGNVAIQVKSNREMKDELIRRMKKQKSQSLIATLERQHSQAMMNYHPLLDYYIVLCADMTCPGMHDLVREITGVFCNPQNVKIIEPQRSFSFFQLNRLTVQALSIRMLCEQDQIYEMVKDSLENYSITQRALIFHVISEFILENGLRSNIDFASLYDSAQSQLSTVYLEQGVADEQFTDCLLSDFNVLIENVISQYSSGECKLNLSEVEDILAFMLDLKIREELTNSDLCSLMLSIFDSPQDVSAGSTYEETSD